MFYVLSYILETNTIKTSIRTQKLPCNRSQLLILIQDFDQLWIYQMCTVCIKVLRARIKSVSLASCVHPSKSVTNKKDLLQPASQCRTSGAEQSEVSRTYICVCEYYIIHCTQTTNIWQQSLFTDMSFHCLLRCLSSSAAKPRHYSALKKCVRKPIKDGIIWRGQGTVRLLSSNRSTPPPVHHNVTRQHYVSNYLCIFINILFIMFNLGSSVTQIG